MFKLISWIISRLRKEGHKKPFQAPSHIAIIMDGNRRWAKKRLLPALAGHAVGAKTLKTIVNAAIDFHVEQLTVFAFSTENWFRSQEEVDSIFKVLETFLIKERDEMVKKGIALDTIGDLSKLPEKLLNIVLESKKITSSGKKIRLVLALNYGGRDEIARAIKKMAWDLKENKLTPEEITEELISQYLDTEHGKDPELLIRTSGEMRISNFLLWQISYAEIYVTDRLWPDFSKNDLKLAIEEYMRRDKRLGA